MAVERQIIGRRPISWAVVSTKSFYALPFFQKYFISTPTNAINIPTNVFMSSFETKKLGKLLARLPGRNCEKMRGSRL